jgi:hypothetical protein
LVEIEPLADGPACATAGSAKKLRSETTKVVSARVGFMAILRRAMLAEGPESSAKVESKPREA